MRKLAKGHKVNISGIRYLLDDLGMFFKANATHHLITGSAKLKKLEGCRTLLLNTKFIMASIFTRSQPT
jgi:hypothetical protein